MAGQFLLINGKSINKRQITSNPAVAYPVDAQAAAYPVDVEAELPAGGAGAVDTNERTFGLIGSLIARHRMRQAMKYGMMGGMGMGSFGFGG